MRTQVAIVGAGPAGLLLGHILQRAGIGFVILERRSRPYVLGRIRAGVLEQGSVDTLHDLGLDADLAVTGLTHNGIHLQWEGKRQHLDFRELVGRTVTIYGQQALVRHLLAEHDKIGSTVRFGVEGVTPRAVDSDSPFVTIGDGADAERIDCDYIVGADGYHGVCRPIIPGVRSLGRGYPFAWLGILADVAPSTDDLIYALHPRGFAMHSMRSRVVSRFYFQIEPGESIGDWDDEKIWAELQTRLGMPGWRVAEGPILEKSITPMRSFVASTLQHGRLFLAGDAGHIVPPTGAKGLNSAIADVALLGRSLAAQYRGDSALLRRYSDSALARQWKVQQFSQWMTDLLHLHHEFTDEAARAFRYRSQVGQLEFLASSRNAQAALAEQYAGLPF